MQIPGVMLVGTDTEVGKTYVSCRLIEQWVRLGIRVGAYKPVASGALSEELSDANLLWNASGRLGTLQKVNPQSFSAPLAPPVAAELEGREVDDELLIQGASAWENHCDFLLVEGAGGLMSPISWTMTNASLAHKLNLPVILVAPNKLGVVSQVLTTLTAAKALQLEVIAVVLNNLIENEGDLDPSTRSQKDISSKTNFQLLARFMQTLSLGECTVSQLKYGSKIFEPPILTNLPEILLGEQYLETHRP